MMSSQRNAWSYCRQLGAMPLTVRLDAGTEDCLAELMAETGQDKSSLIRQLIRERWQQLQPLPSITKQLGGHPESCTFFL
jgi:hypothetical protein